MTINKILEESGFKVHRNDAGKIGMLVMAKAKERNIKWRKVKELVEVNDYPDELVLDIQSIVIDYFTKKNKSNAKV